jgi:hypothetical protein
MKYILFILAITSLGRMSCNKNNPALPACIEQKIKEIKAQPRWNPPAEVSEYLYENKTVYLFSSNCCDQYNMVYDRGCNVVCAPSGGYTGKGDMKCEDFFAKAKLIKLIWKDER